MPAPLRSIAYAVLTSILGWIESASGQVDNHFVTLSLHVEVGLIDACDPALSYGCCSFWPRTEVPANTEVTVFLMASDALCVPLTMHLQGIQTAFEWDSSWKFLGSSWDCQSNQKTTIIPQNPGGAFEGTLITSFDCAEGQATEVIGRLYFRTGEDGSLWQVRSDYPAGIHVLDCEAEIDELDLRYPRLGAISVDNDGESGCWDPNPVTNVTWGRIKTHYSE